MKPVEPGADRGDEGQRLSRDAGDEEGDQLPAAAAAGEQRALAAATFHEKRQRAPRLDGAGLLKRTFKVDVFSCPKCAGRRRVLAWLTEGAVLRRILRHLQLPELSPLVPARGPPQQALGN